ncbi:hypothetical protein MCOR27_008058 [Pyricularia oryzae]|uniref:Uncharacterized protein n=2 Tax=Pyricularia TaxID=48558 RepID=A0ABQ8NVM3_PYRGI|nr:hypothetical protein MCOR01_006425 [Pyricularia oryzae]KAI6302517.1 hypothetical protein MCOR33_002104 [Pyricularia grisea]KAH9435770.1 hypothetical protein MCOR02_004688 [Pyricularia oryzae]KAI6255095.1 hypothetical protein MCOR19_008397 [Pyricularia oryzae]KAI6273031.1 hypothetical protein MCOR27_008058 [Pyricularia oryzae]
MADVPRSATARLRKTFQYPTDDSSSSTPEVLDEEEQDNLIQSLADQNAARNAQFRIAMLALPVLSTLPYLVILFRRPEASLILPTLLSISSLASTTWLLYAQDPTETGIAALDSWARGAGLDNSNGNNPPFSPLRRAPGGSRRRRLSSFSAAAGGGVGVYGRGYRSPLETYLPLLNAGLCALLLLMAVLIALAPPEGRTAPEHVSRVMLACLPAVVYAVVIAAKLVMSSVDPERDLTGLKYENKGA